MVSLREAVMILVISPVFQLRVVGGVHLRILRPMPGIGVYFGLIEV
jgi:hypothetical protein